MVSLNSYTRYHSRHPLPSPLPGGEGIKTRVYLAVDIWEQNNKNMREHGLE